MHFPQNASSMAMLMSHTWTSIPYFIPNKLYYRQALLLATGFMIILLLYATVVLNHCWLSETSNPSERNAFEWHQ